MADEKQAIAIPEVPEPVGALAPRPEKKKQEWRDTYVRALKQARIDVPEDPVAQASIAKRRANQMDSVDEPTSYEEAAAIEPWQLMHRSERDGVLNIVPIDGKKYSFPIPAPEPKAKK